MLHVLPKIVGHEIVRDPMFCLLCIKKETSPIKKHMLTDLFLAVAVSRILRHWKSTEVPVLGDWLTALAEIYEIDSEQHKRMI